MSALACLYFYIINFSCTYRHLSSGQGVRKNVTMESVVLGHHVCKVFWMPAIGKKLPLAQEDAIKHEKYAVVVANHGKRYCVHSMAMSKLSWDFLER